MSEGVSGRVRLVWALVLVALITGACASGGDPDPTSSSGDGDPASTDTTSALDPPPVVPPAGEPDTAVQSSVDRGVAYLAQGFPAPDGIAPMIYAHLGRRYGWSDLGPVPEAVRAGYTGNTTIQMRELVRWFEAWGELFLPVAVADPAPLAAPMPAPADDVEASQWLIGWGSRCDESGFPTDEFAEVANRALVAGSQPDDTWYSLYYTTHLAVAFIAMHEQGCERGALDGLRAQTVDQLRAVFANAPPPGVAGVNDPLIEGMLVLAELDGPSAIDPKWMELLLAGQLDDGGWPINAGETESNWHPTLLAAGVLARWLEPTLTAPIIIESTD